MFGNCDRAEGPKEKGGEEETFDNPDAGALFAPEAANLVHRARQAKPASQRKGEGQERHRGAGIGQRPKIAPTQSATPTTSNPTGRAKA